MFKVLFVCTGNICRSPTAHGIFRDLAARAGLSDRIVVESAGTHAYHVGQPPDSRSSQAALRRGCDLSDLRARQVSRADYLEFDLILAMDRGHYSHLLSRCPQDRRDKLALFLSFAPRLGTLDVPDPYYGGADGFENVLDMIEEGSAGLLEHIRTLLP